MTDFIDQISAFSPKRLALLAVKLKDGLDEAHAAAREPVAVIGIGCRFPSADGPDAFWALLREGRDAIREVPADRWKIDEYFDPDPDAPGKVSTRSGGFLDRIDGFDPHFFGIAPREAVVMDPQQRLLLEVSWEALEHAGLALPRLAGSRTGVFVGICNSDYHQLLLARGAEAIDAYLASGSAHSVASGRLSYVLGFQGPALSIDTSCSASLVAIHAACQSLRSGESTLALAGGVNIICAPETSIALSKGHMLAPDGRCKTFDAAADGFSRAEGCGMVVLKRLSDARRDGDRILALVRGSAINQDGRSGGLTVPNGPAQEAVIRDALAAAGAQAADIEYVEAHGTGTSLGDPIEVRALGRVLGEGRDPSNPLVIGSVKTNFGHLELAAGVAGFIKVVLALQNEEIPSQLHFKTPSPHIEWASLQVAVAAERRAWPRAARRRLAGVSSFGFSGTNAHVVLEEAPPREPKQDAHQPSLHCLPLSARSDAALAQLVGRYEKALAPGAEITLADAAHTAAVGRSHLTQRLALVAESAEAASAALRAFTAGEPDPALHRGTAVPGQASEVVFLFTGQGSQYPGMGQLLYETSPVFRAVIDRCDGLLGADPKGRTLKSVLWSAPGGDAPIHDTAWTQPALFAVEYGLTQLWRSWGIEPAAVIGHSVGEYVAACVAGVFTLEDGLRLIVERGRLMRALPPGGAMAAVFASIEVVEAAIGPMSERLAIAAINAPDSVVVSGDAAAVGALLAEFAQQDVRGQLLFVSQAFHSPLVGPALDAMETCARTIPMAAPRIPVAWNLTGSTTLPSGTVPDAIYWRRHMREPVRFADGIAALHREGFRTYLEVGPHPTLIALAKQSLSEALFLPSMRRGKNDWHELLSSLAELYVHGAPVDWAGVDRPYARRRVALPTYPFERRSYWLSPPKTGLRRPRAPSRSANPLLGNRLPTAVPIFETTLTPDEPWYLADHGVRGAVLVAGAVFLEMAQSCARETTGRVARAVEAFVIRKPLVLNEQGRAVQIHLGDLVDGIMPFSIYSRGVNETGDWQLHVDGRLEDVAETTLPFNADTTPIATLQQELGPAIDCDMYYERLAGLGVDLRGGFRNIREAYRREGEALVRIEVSSASSEAVVTWAHPLLLDGAVQACGLAVSQPSDAAELYLLTEIERIELTGPLPTTLSLWCHACVRDPDRTHPSERRTDVVLRGPDGASIGAVRGVCLRRASHEALDRAVGSIGPAAADGLFYEVVWEPAPAEVGATTSLTLPVRFVPTIQARFAKLADQHRLAIYDQLLPELDRLSSEYVAMALRRLGFDATVGRVFTSASEMTHLGVAKRHARLFARMLDMLTEDGILRPQGGRLEVLAPLASADPAQRYDTILTCFGEVNGELSTLRRCGAELARVLTGEQDPLQLLFPGGSLIEARQLYVESPFARTYNAALGEALQAAIAALPEGARLRVLEIGAGTGGTTTHVLPLLPADRVDYTFTDMSPFFLEHAAEQFVMHPFVRCALLDIERDPLRQGFEVGKYDIVIAANVLHATKDLRQAVQHIRSLLTSGGLLFALEGVAPERWVDLTFGLTTGWWRFTDASLRADYPLIGRDAWRGLLEGLGFTGVATIPDGVSGLRAAGQQVLIVARAPLVQRQWTLVGDVDGVGAALANHLLARGHAVTLLSTDAADATVAPGELVYLGALELASRQHDDLTAVGPCKALACELPIRWLARVSQVAGSVRAWLVTRGAQPVQGSALEGARWQAPLWGLGRVFALEQPNSWGGLVDLPPEGSAETLAQTLVAATDAGDGEDQTAWREGARFAARLVPAPAPLGLPVRFLPDATYLVTGGFGGLGLLVARWMAECGARHIALLGRRPDPMADTMRAIEALGARVIPLAGDVADEAGMTALLARLVDEAPPLRGIIHLAADLSSAPIDRLTSAQVQSMLRPKIDGTALLERLTSGQELDFLVLFSSTASLLGFSSYAHYSAANSFLDATAQSASRHGRRVLSVNWGFWEATGLASSENSYRHVGVEPMRASEALDALGRLLSGSEPQAVVGRFNWSVLKPLLEGQHPRPFLSRLRIVSPPANALARPRARSGSAPGLIERLQLAPTGIRHELLMEFVQQEVVAVLGLDTSEPASLERDLFEMGMDSLMSVQLTRRLERGAGRSLPSTLTFNYPNVGALVGFLEGILAERWGIPDSAEYESKLQSSLAKMSEAEIDALLVKVLAEGGEA